MSEDTERLTDLAEAMADLATSLAKRAKACETLIDGTHVAERSRLTGKASAYDHAATLLREALAGATS